MHSRLFLQVETFSFFDNFTAILALSFVVIVVFITVFVLQTIDSGVAGRGTPEFTEKQLLHPSRHLWVAMMSN